MKSTAYYVLIFFMLIFFLFLNSTICADETAAKKITFTWAFLYADDGQTIKPIDYEEPTQVLSDGTRLKIYIKPIENVFIYLLQKNPNGSLTLLFPGKLSHFNEFYTPGKSYYIPPGENWLSPALNSGFSSGTPEEITFYFIATGGRLIKLESLLKKYFSSMEDPGKKQAEAMQAVIEHIKKLRLEYSSFTPKKQEIVLIAGEFRGPEDGFEFPALDIIADTFYAKTIRITY